MGTPEYERGKRDARLNDMMLLSQALHGMIEETGEITQEAAHHLYAVLYGPDEAKEEFGSDERVDNVMRQLFPK